MNTHRDTCIKRLTELAEDPALRPYVIEGLCVASETQLLSLTVQYVLEERDRQMDAQAAAQVKDELESRPTRG